MANLDLRQKFSLGLTLVVVVSLTVLLGVRLLSKGALFHHLEREHLSITLHLSQDLDRAAFGKLTLTRDALVQRMEDARDIARRAETELFAPEKLAFRALGFGDILDLPTKDIGDLGRMAPAPSPPN